MDVLSEVLKVVKLQGAMFYNGEFSSPWSFCSPPSRTVFAPAYVGLGNAYIQLGTVLVGAPPEKERAEAVSARTARREQACAASAIESVWTDEANSRQGPQDSEGERKTGKGLIASQASILHDPKKMAELGFEEGIGFVPFAGIGWGAIKAIRKDDSSPVRAAAAKVLARDPDPAATKALAEATGDDSWIVRAAALEALAKRGDPSALPTVEQYMSDEKNAIKFTAAAAVIHLTAIKVADKRKRPGLNHKQP
jgi:hypothetical protein